MINVRKVKAAGLCDCCDKKRQHMKCIAEYL